LQEVQDIVPASMVVEEVEVGREEGEAEELERGEATDVGW
jgi:hypothetical protein